MDTKQKIQSYFFQQSLLRKQNYENYMIMSKKAFNNEEKKMYEEKAWVEGVKMVSVLDDMEKDILKLI
jgi:hypothetical protein